MPTYYIHLRQPDRILIHGDDIVLPDHEAAQDYVRQVARELTRNRFGDPLGDLLVLDEQWQPLFEIPLVCDMP